MPKGTDNFKQVIQAHIDQMAADDPLFAESLEKEEKDIDGCINYILSQVKKIGAQGYTDGEIFGMAAHYYDEDDLEECDPVKMRIVVNHKPELTEEEIAQEKEKARRQILSEERRRLHAAGTPKAKKKKQEAEQSNLFSS